MEVLAGTTLVPEDREVLGVALEDIHPLPEDRVIHHQHLHLKETMVEPVRTQGRGLALVVEGAHQLRVQMERQPQVVTEVMVQRPPFLDLL